MHEVAIAQRILDVVKDKAEECPEGSIVEKITVKIGTMRNIDSESLLFAFNAIKKGNPSFARCELNLIDCRLSAHCARFGHLYYPEVDQNFRCPTCAGGMGQIISGDELDIVAFALTKEDACTRS